MPCRLRLGWLPKPGSSASQELGSLAGIAQAVRDGDVRTYSQELEKQECDLMAAGTYLVVEKLRLLAYRNLCRRVHSHLAREHDQGRAEFKHKQDLEPYEVAFA